MKNILKIFKHYLYFIFMSLDIDINLLQYNLKIKR